MKQRFRRENNLANLHPKKTQKSSPKTNITEKIRDNLGAPFTGSFLKSYKVLQGTMAWRNATLLVAVSLCLLVAAAWALPKVFSFQFDVSHIITKLIPEPAISAEEEKNGINFLIL